MIKVMIVEDQKMVRQSLEIILNNKPDITVVGTAEDGEQAVANCARLLPDIILLDIRMPNMNGVSACRIIKQNHPNIKIIVLTTFDDDEYVFNAIKYGASGYILKGNSVEELVNAVKTVYNGGTLINPTIASKLVAYFSKMANNNVSTMYFSEEIPALNKTENKIVALIKQGLSSKEIAEALFLSVGTVRNNISNILTKLNLRDRTQIAIYSSGQSSNWQGELEV